MTTTYEMYIDRVDNGYYVSMTCGVDGLKQYGATRVFTTEGELTGWLLTTLMGDANKKPTPVLVSHEELLDEIHRGPTVYQPLTKFKNALKADISASAPLMPTPPTPRRINATDERDEHGVWKTPPAFEEEN